MIHSEICCQGRVQMIKCRLPSGHSNPSDQILTISLNSLFSFSACMIFLSFHLHAYSSILFICMHGLPFCSFACIVFFLFIYMHGHLFFSSACIASFSFHLHALSLFFSSVFMVFFSCHLHALSSFLFIYMHGHLFFHLHAFHLYTWYSFLFICMHSLLSFHLHAWSSFRIISRQFYFICSYAVLS